LTGVGGRGGVGGKSGGGGKTDEPPGIGKRGGRKDPRRTGENPFGKPHGKGGDKKREKLPEKLKEKRKFGAGLGVARVFATDDPGDPGRKAGRPKINKIDQKNKLKFRQITGKRSVRRVTKGRGAKIKRNALWK
jgi:hypothetical protein